MTTQADKTFLDAIRLGEKAKEVELATRAFADRFRSGNGDTPSGDEESKMLYEMAKWLPDRMMETNVKYLNDAGYMTKRKLEKRLNELKKSTEVPAAPPPPKPVPCAVFDGLIDLIDDEGCVKFLIKNDSGIHILDQYPADGKILVPPVREQIPWTLPRKVALLTYKEEPDRLLFDRLLSYFRGVSELPSKRHYLLVAAWVLHTFLLENFQYSPMLYFFAVPERGKSRTGKGITYVTYRGLHVESVRDAYIVRMASEYGGTLFFDCMDLWKKAVKTESEDILLQRFEKGARVPRVLDPTAGPHQGIRYFKIFGPTIIASNEAISHILETRALSISMPDSERTFEDDITPDDVLPIKEALTCFRLRHYGKPLPHADKPARGRLGDILRPLLQVVRLAAPDLEGEFMELIEELVRGRRFEKAESSDAKLVQAVADLTGKVSGGFLPVKDITDTFNADKPERFHWPSQRIGRALKALGFERKLTASGTSAIAYDEAKIARLMLSYGLKETPERPEDTEKPEETEVISCVSEPNNADSVQHTNTEKVLEVFGGHIRKSEPPTTAEGGQRNE